MYPQGKELINMQGLYIHIPFCRKKCLYCDFYSVPLQAGSAEQYAAAVIRNLQSYGGCFDTVYFGGGTPILLAEQIPDILAAAEISPQAEITVECNPCEMSEQALLTLRNAGVNRISVGVQSFCDNELIALGRRHDSEAAIEAIQLAARMGFDNISADLMLGIPQQNKASLNGTLEIMSMLPVTHISAYMLKIEPSTPFGRSTPNLPDEDEAADMYLQTVRFLERQGLAQYEISNFARQGCESRHNLKYWRAEEYLGIGPAAHSFIGGRRFAVPRDLRGFLRSQRQQEQLTEENPDPVEEQLMLGLRLAEGVSEQLWKPLEAALSRVPESYYSIEGGRLRLTAEGFLLSNEIIALLLAAR